MGKGGKRIGAGRKVGSNLVKRSRATAEKVVETGQTPLDVMVENMRHFQQVALDAEATIEGLTAEKFWGRDISAEEQFKEILAQVKKAAGLRQMAHECARDAAPYIHTRLAATTLTGPGGGAIQVVIRGLAESIEA